MNLRRGFSAALLVVGVVLAPHAAVGTTSPPSVTITKATVDRAARTVDLRLRICLSSGPRALIAVKERRTYRGVVRASNDWIVPRGVEPTHISRFACRSGWRVNWLLKPFLRGPGTYDVSVRVRDAYARWTAPVAFSVTSP